MGAKSRDKEHCGPALGDEVPTVPIPDSAAPASPPARALTCEEPHSDLEVVGKKEVPDFRKLIF